MIMMSPMCTAFSAIQNINKYRRPKDVIEKEIAEARRHIKFAMRICALQHKHGRYFVFEHPATASSWKLEEIMKIRRLEGVHITKFDMCEFGMYIEDKNGAGLAMKRTAVMTNSPEVAKRLQIRCRNTTGSADRHQHIKLEGGKRCKHAQVYPR